MDVMMPKMDGYTAVEKIKTEMDPAPLVMMLTAKGTEDDVMQGLMGGADDYITKPFAPRELIARVKVTLIKAGRKADLPPE
jgi:DNA-binding response OmpR family regulator